MKKIRFIYLLLLPVSLMLAIAPAIPHHHHGDGIICMKDDIREEPCYPAHPDHHHEADDPCCNPGCLTHFDTVVPHPTEINGLSPDFQYYVILFTQPLLSFIGQAEKTIPDENRVLAEKLHGTYLTRAAGVRAP